MSFSLSIIVLFVSTLRLAASSQLQLQRATHFTDPSKPDAYVSLSDYFVDDVLNKMFFFLTPPQQYGQKILYGLDFGSTSPGDLYDPTFRQYYRSDFSQDSVSGKFYMYLVGKNGYRGPECGFYVVKNSTSEAEPIFKPNCAPYIEHLDLYNDAGRWGMLVYDDYLLWPIGNTQEMYQLFGVNLRLPFENRTIETLMKNGKTFPGDKMRLYQNKVLLPLANGDFWTYDSTGLRQIYSEPEDVWETLWHTEFQGKMYYGAYNLSTPGPWFVQRTMVYDGQTIEESHLPVWWKNAGEFMYQYDFQSQTITQTNVYGKQRNVGQFHFTREEDLSVWMIPQSNNGNDLFVIAQEPSSYPLHATVTPRIYHVDGEKGETNWVANLTIPGEKKAWASYEGFCGYDDRVFVVVTDKSDDSYTCGNTLYLYTVDLKSGATENLGSICKQTMEGCPQHCPLYDREVFCTKDFVYVVGNPIENKGSVDLYFVKRN